MEKISFSYKGKKVKISAIRVGALGRIMGLMFRSLNNSEPLLFNFNKEVNLKIHSLFVFFPFVAVWLDGKRNVVDIKKVEPFTFSVSSKKDFTTLIEIPLNQKNSAIVGKLGFLVGS